MACAVHYPPERKLHSLDFTRERILLAGSNEAWKEELLSELKDQAIDIFVPNGVADWQFEQSCASTVIPLLFDNEEDVTLLSLLGKHLVSGKVIVCCTEQIPFADHVRALCDFEGVQLLTEPSDLTTTVLKRLGCATKDHQIVVNND